MIKLYGVSCCHRLCHHLCHHLCCQLLCQQKQFPCPINYIMYDRTMRTVQQSIALFTSLLLLLLLLLIVVYDCVGTYDETIIMDVYVDEWWCQSPCWICCHVRVHSFPPGYLLHCYSKHIQTFGWCCRLFYNIMVSCWYGWMTWYVRQNDNNHSWWCHDVLSLSVLYAGCNE